MKRKIQWGTMIFLCIYLLVLVYVCFLSEAYGRTELQNTYHYNLIPFREIIRFYTYRKNVGIEAFVLNLFGNVLAFMPFGFMIQRLFRRSETICFRQLRDRRRLAVKILPFPFHAEF